jgi:hypothetical protein
VDVPRLVLRHRFTAVPLDAERCPSTPATSNSPAATFGAPACHAWCGETENTAWQARSRQSRERRRRTTADLARTVLLRSDVTQRCRLVGQPVHPHHQPPCTIARGRRRVHGEPEAVEKVPYTAPPPLPRSSAPRLLAVDDASPQGPFRYRHREFAAFCKAPGRTIHTDDGFRLCRCGGISRIAAVTRRGNAIAPGGFVLASIRPSANHKALTQSEKRRRCSPHERSDMREY